MILRLKLISVSDFAPCRPRHGGLVISIGSFFTIVDPALYLLWIRHWKNLYFLAFLTWTLRYLFRFQYVLSVAICPAAICQFGCFVAFFR